MLEISDIVSVHAPLTPETENLMDKKAFERMKKSAIFLNLGRGPIVSEQDLADALNAGEIRGAALDVLCAEPMSPDNPGTDQRIFRNLARHLPGNNSAIQ